MSAIERAERDEREGDLGSARHRLRSYLATVGYDADVCERIARLCVRMGDPVEAGRWYYLCESADPEAAPAVERFKANLGGDPRQVFLQIPAKIRAVEFGRLPPEANALVEKWGPPRVGSPPRTPPSKFKNAALEWGCVAVVLLAIAGLLATLLVGLVVIARWSLRAAA